MPDAAPLDMDQLWVLVAAGLVFLMQGGFLLLEVGATRPEHGLAVGLKNLVDWVVATLCFSAVGYALMFGTSAGGVLGTDLFGLSGVLDGSAEGPVVGHLVFFLFQLGFCGTAITIVSGAMAERTGFVAYMAISAVAGLLIFPLFGHWAWGGLVTGGQPGWLADLGFIDFAGSTVVHSVGGWIALVGIVLVGPRLGRYGADGKPKALPSSHLGLSALGVLVLWLGWWGFNGGSTLVADLTVPRIILVTSLAGAAAGLAAVAHCWWAQSRQGLAEKLIGGTLCGLVAVTASAHAIPAAAAVGLGVVAGLAHNVAYDGMHRFRLDDPVGAVPVHLVGGVLGTLAVPLVLPADALELGRLPQLGVQALGVLVCAVWTAGLAYLVLRLVRSTIGLRVSPAQERAGDAFGLVGRARPVAVAVPAQAPVPVSAGAVPAGAVATGAVPAANLAPEVVTTTPGAAEDIDDDELSELLG